MNGATSYQYPKVYLYRRVVQAKLYIDVNYAEKIDLNNIADEACFSKFHFIRLFRTVYGKTPHQYLKAIRMEKAKLLLREGRPVSDACFLVGFDSLSSFSGLFKRMTGQSASDYAAQHRRSSEQKRLRPLSFVPGCYAYQHGWTENSNFEETDQ